MKRVPAVLVILVAALLTPTLAHAKELSAFKACGAAGCRQIKDRAVLRTLIRAVEAQGEPVSVPTPAPSPFIRLDFFMRGDEGTGPAFRQYYIPSRGVLLIQTDPNAWAWVSARNIQTVLARVTRSVKPYAAPTITRITVGGRSLFDRDEYARLFTTRPTTYSVPDEPDWVDVKVKTTRPSPWSTTAATLAYSPSTKVLWRGSEFVVLPDSLDNSSHDSLRWALLLGGLGSAAVVVPAALVWRRRRTG